MSGHRGGRDRVGMRRGVVYDGLTVARSEKALTGMADGRSLGVPNREDIMYRDGIGVQKCQWHSGNDASSPVTWNAHTLRTC